MNKKTVAIDDNEYRKIIEAISNGFTYMKDGKKKRFFPNKRIETILKLQAVLGLRISDILNLKLSDILKDGDRYRLDIVEKKTKKSRTFTVPSDVYKFICSYAAENNINRNSRLFDITERTVQKQLQIASEYLGIPNVSTHSFRKRFATQTYVNSHYNIELVRHLLQHSTTAVTQRYIGVGSKQVEEALASVSGDLLV